MEGAKEKLFILVGVDFFSSRTGFCGVVGCPIASIGRFVLYEKPCESVRQLVEFGENSYKKVGLVVNFVYIVLKPFSTKNRYFALLKTW